MDNHPYKVFHVADRSYFALVKKDIHVIGVQLGFSSEKVGQLDIIIAELVSNIVKYAVEGHLYVKTIDLKGNPGIEIICCDNGPGIADIKRMMQDGTSTKNTLGHGLGAIQRLSDKFDIYTQKGWGTIILSRIFRDPISLFTPRFTTEIKGLLVPKKGEEVCGDGYYYKLSENKLKVFLGDGLGHGPDAHAAVSEAMNKFKHCHEESPAEILRYVHDGVKKTRGLVGSVAIFDFNKQEWSVCGVGNIATRICNFSACKNYVSYNGIIGHNIPRTLKEQHLPYEPGQYVIMCSDGIRTKWELNNFTGIHRNDLSLLAAAIYKDQTRNSDDSSVVVAKINL